MSVDSKTIKIHTSQRHLSKTRLGKYYLTGTFLQFMSPVYESFFQSPDKDGHLSLPEICGEFLNLRF